MSLEKIEMCLMAQLSDMQAKGTVKGTEIIITGITPEENGFGPRYHLEGCGDKTFLRMNSNSYLGLGLNRQVIDAEARAAEKFGCGPGAVRFISGTYQPHIELEQELAGFHGRESTLIVSSAYVAVIGILPQLISEKTLVVSDALNHNCIINAMRLSRPAQKAVYPHLDMAELEKILETNKGLVKRVILVTDGVFSMRGDYAPLDKIAKLCNRHEQDYEEGIVTIVDDSHGIGAFGRTGRGTEEYTDTQVDILIATLGKAFGVNGGYVVSNANIINYLRETVPVYIYSNPITPAEAVAALKSLEILGSNEGLILLNKLRALTARSRSGLKRLGFETLDGEHPIVPVLIRDTKKTSDLAQHLFDNNILATGLNFPVVPRGEEEIRLQIAADHTDKDIDYLLAVMKKF